MRHALRNARLARHWTQQQLADTVGVARSYISLIEQGTYTPSLRLAKRFADALDISVDVLFFEDSNVRNSHAASSR